MRIKKHVTIYLFVVK